MRAEMKTILDELVGALERAAASGLMSEADSRVALEHTEKLYKELYQKYDEFKEADVMLQDKILTYSEEAELRGIERGIEKERNYVIELINQGLTIDEIKRRL